MATLTIRKYPMSRFSSSKKWLRKQPLHGISGAIHSRRMAGWPVAHEITRKTNFYDEIREFMKNMDFEGLDKGELPLSERNSADSRPPVSF